MIRLLYLEDDPVIGKAVTLDISREGFTVTWAKSLAEARKAVKAGEHDIALLDINLPDGLSFDFCRELRQEFPSLPILFVTGNTDEDSAVKGLSLGALDYIRKPFSRKELLLRLKAHVRHKTGSLNTNGLEIDLDRKTASFKGTKIVLRPKEFELLTLLTRRFGEPVSREAILQEIDEEAEMNDTTLSSHVSRLRTKLRDAGADELQIVSVYGNGYQLEKRK